MAARETQTTTGTVLTYGTECLNSLSSGRVDERSVIVRYPRPCCWSLSDGDITAHLSSPGRLLDGDR